jgi:hypothetical protein
MAMVNDRPDASANCSPELSAEQFEEMLAELDAICQKARELNTQITRQMADQKDQDRPVAGPLRFPRPVQARRQP